MRFLKIFWCVIFATGSHSVAQANLRLLVLLLPQHSECQGYICELIWQTLILFSSVPLYRLPVYHR